MILSMESLWKLRERSSGLRLLMDQKGAGQKNSGGKTANLQLLQSHSPSTVCFRLSTSFQASIFFTSILKLYCKYRSENNFILYGKQRAIFLHSLAVTFHFRMTNINCRCNSQRTLSVQINLLGSLFSKGYTWLASIPFHVGLFLS